MFKGFTIITFISIFSCTTFASSYDLNVLDKGRSCQTSIQKQMGQRTLSWFTAYASEDFKRQLSLFSEDFMLFHSALAALAIQVEGNPNVKLPFTSGPVTKKNYIDTLALIAYTNDQSAPGDVPIQVNCLGRDTVVVTVAFKGIQVKRDSSGYITYRAPYAGQAMKMFVFDEQTMLIKRHYIDFDPSLSAKAKADIARQISEGNAPAAPNESSRRTLQEITKQYYDSAARAEGL
jgi:hypothetical protein